MTACLFCAIPHRLTQIIKDKMQEANCNMKSKKYIHQITILTALWVKYSYIYEDISIAKKI